MTAGGISNVNPQATVHYEKYIHSLGERYAEEQMTIRHDNHLLPPHVEKERLMLEFEQQINVDEYNGHLDRAFTILSGAAENIFSPLQKQQYTEEMNQASEVLSNFTFESMPSTSLATFLGIQANTLTAVHDLARDTFDTNPQDSLSLYTLLATLDDRNSSSWYELGTALQDLKDFEKAIRAYQACLNLDSSHLMCKLFLGECYINNKQHDDATVILGQAKTQIEVLTDVEPEVLAFFTTLENSLEHGLKP